VSIVSQNKSYMSLCWQISTSQSRAVYCHSSILLCKNLQSAYKDDNRPRLYLILLPTKSCRRSEISSRVYIKVWCHCVTNVTFGLNLRLFWCLLQSRDFCPIWSHQHSSMTTLFVLVRCSLYWFWFIAELKEHCRPLFNFIQSPQIEDWSIKLPVLRQFSVKAT